MLDFYQDGRKEREFEAFHLMGTIAFLHENGRTWFPNEDSLNSLMEYWGYKAVAYGTEADGSEELIYERASPVSIKGVPSSLVLRYRQHPISLCRREKGGDGEVLSPFADGYDSVETDGIGIVKVMTFSGEMAEKSDVMGKLCSLDSSGFNRLPELFEKISKSLSDKTYEGVRHIYV